MSKPDSKAIKQILLLLILLVASYLRLSRINFGLPYSLVPEESDFISKIFYLSKHFLNPHTLAVPSFFLYLNTIVLHLWSFTLNTTHLIELLDAAPSNIFFPLRFLSALLGVGSVVLTYLIGGFFGSLTSILASAFLSVSLVSVIYSKVFLPFSALVFFSLFSLFFVLKSFSTKDEISLKYSTVLACLSASMNYLGIVSLVPIFFVLALQKNLSKLKNLLFLFAILYFILNPYLLFYVFCSIPNLITDYSTSLFYYKSSSYFLYLFSFLLTGVGPVIWTSSLFLFSYSKEYDQKLIKIVFSLPLIYFGLVGLLHLTGLGYTVMLVPFVCLASALVLNSLVDKFWMAKNTEKKFIFIVLLLFAIYIPLKYTDKFSKIMSLSDTRVIASEWVKENTPGDYKITWDNNSLQLNWYDPYNKNELKTVVSEPETLINKQRFVISEKFLSNKNWFKLLKKKVDYVVINSFDYQKVLRLPYDLPEKRFYKKIFTLTPEITFNPYLHDVTREIRSSVLEDLYLPFDSLFQRERAGPVIKIYKI